MKSLKKRCLSCLLIALLSATGCNKATVPENSEQVENKVNIDNMGALEDEDSIVELGGSEDTFGDDILEDLYAGYFEEIVLTEALKETPTETPTEAATEAPEETPTVAPTVVPTETLSEIPPQAPTATPEPTHTPIPTATPTPAVSANTSDITITGVSGSTGCYTIDGTTITFNNLSEDSVYSISGQFKGNIIIDVGNDYKLDLELHGFSLISDSTNPITVVSGDRVTITAKKDYVNYIYDTREAVDETDDTQYSATIYSLVDLKIAGKGELNIVSENNNGIHTKDDLEVKNLTLTVHCVNNALKGNDSVTLENAATTLIATTGDGIKTTNSNVSEKGNQRGTITITGGVHNIYAACDGIDAAYDVVIDDETTVLNIFTDKYSNYSEEVTAVSEDAYYIRFSSKDWKYSVKYYNSDEDYIWVNPEYHSSASGGRNSYYYYSFPKMQEYSKIQYFIYSADMEQGQETEYLAATDYLSINDGYDTFALESRGNSLSYNWTNYTTTVSENFGGFGGGPGGGRGGMGGFGGMNEGNSDKSEYSTKGIKAANEIVINNGTISIKAYDDAVHANNDTALENGETPKGNVTVNGGIVTLYSNDDGLHADGTVTITNGIVAVTNSYEGIEGAYVEISGGKVSVSSKDDGINGTATTGKAIVISGGELYIYCSGDGIDSNSRTSYEGIVFSGGNTVVISNSNGNSAIDTEKGYQYTGGSVVAIMPSGGMSSEAVHCSDFSDIGSNRTTTIAAENYVTVTVGNEEIVTIQMPAKISGRVIYLGSNAASVSTTEETTAALDANGVCWH